MHMLLEFNICSHLHQTIRISFALKCRTTNLWHVLKPLVGLWLHNFILGVGMFVNSIAKPLKIYCNNTATLFFSKDNKYSKGDKHMKLKYFVIKRRSSKIKIVN